ncbi:acetylxylan esterase [Anaeromyces robustus]|uniref:Acetylxylan esterase n=1 Tax=Anaeromyces robustus TaxID=1754192 RepID=A0A1Y1XF01_9FUNG|nr:acetylxylan esterase [Anaeromyces robustus]|eukprot:ORX84303.1 acetylxylan esterase [Anaeromyces robustus]
MKTNFGIATILTTVLSVITKTYAAPDPNFHIYLAFGQSNMLSGDIESQDKNVDSRFKMISTVNDCGNRRQGEWYTAVPPLASCNAGLGPVPYFGNTLVEKLPKEITVGVAVVGIAGCDIQLFEKDRYQSYEHADWMTGYINEYGGNPYGRLVESGKIAQKSGVIKGILVHQGETNNGNQDWPKRLKGVYENLLKDLSLKAEEVPLLVGELVQSNKGGICGDMNSIIQRVPEVIPTAHVVSSEGLEQQGDGFHFTSASHRILGKRYAEVMLSILDGTTPISQNGTGTKIDGPNSIDSPSTQNNDTECFSLALGYSCCQKTTAVIYEDKDGKWGIENNQWCGIKPTTSNNNCWSVDLGYPCCKSTNEVYVTDENGKWGLENNNWCGIPN